MLINEKSSCYRNSRRYYQFNLPAAVNDTGAKLCRSSTNDAAIAPLRLSSTHSTRYHQASYSVTSLLVHAMVFESSPQSVRRVSTKPARDSRPSSWRREKGSGP